MYLKIHKNTKEADCFYVEFLAEKERIIIDMGIPAVNPDGFLLNDKEFENLSKEELIRKGILPDIPSLYEESTDTSLYISHPHKYHYELLKHIHPSCPIYMSKTTYWMIRKICEFLGRDWSFENVNIFDSYYNPFRIGDAVDDYVFCISTKLLSFNNSRNHNKKILDYFLKKNVPTDIDYLLFGADDIGGTYEKFQPDEEILEELVRTFKKTRGIILVLHSVFDIATIEIIYRACRRCHKMFLIDFFTANVLKTINKKVNDSIPFPSRENHTDVFVYYPDELWDIAEEKKTKKQFVDSFLKKQEVDYNFYLPKLDKMTDRIVMLIHPDVQSELEEYLHQYSSGCLINSMPESYRQDPKIKQFLDFITGKGMAIKDIHTSGHDLPTFRKAGETVNPKNLVNVFKMENCEIVEL